MMLYTSAAFWVVSILFAIAPGADWAYAISAGLRDRAVPPAVSGLRLGHLAVIVIVAAGVGAAAASAPVALKALTLAGSAYLLWLGVNMLAHPPAPGTDGHGKSERWLRWVAKGFGVSGLNPKVYLLLLALLPQFTNPAAGWPIPEQILALGLVHIVNCGAVYLFVGFGSRAVLRAEHLGRRINLRRSFP